jgi:hypothetical protein
VPVSLRSLSDHDVLARTRDLVERERALTIDVLHHLNEIERRRLHLQQGYASMFDYCTAGLGYSASAAIRRIRTARCAARFPELLPLLESNEVNLSTVAQVSRILTPTNVADVLTRVRGKSQRQVEAVVAAYEPRAAMPDRVRTVVMRVPCPAPVAAPRSAESPLAEPQPALATTQCEGVAVSTAAQPYNRNGCDRGISPAGEPPATDGTGEVPATSHRMRLECRAVVQFSASEAFMAKVEKVRAIAWHRLPADASLEQVFELALDLFLEKEDPSARNARRQERRVASGSAAPTGKPPEEHQKEAPTRREHIPARVRDEVFVRDRSQCTYTAPGGRRCGSRSALQMDHILPVARGGPSTAGNLRLLCAYHNRLEAERIMGRAGARPDPGGC